LSDWLARTIKRRIASKKINGQHTSLIWSLRFENVLLSIFNRTPAFHYNGDLNPTIHELIAELKTQS